MVHEAILFPSLLFTAGKMTGCCASGCHNRSEKGFKMYRFPANISRKEKWENAVSRLGWKSTSSTFLCQVPRTLAVAFCLSDYRYTHIMRCCVLNIVRLTALKSPLTRSVSVLGGHKMAFKFTPEGDGSVIIFFGFSTT